jgi:tetratricopeptide (TPR) repeat protein
MLDVDYNLNLSRSIEMNEYNSLISRMLENDISFDQWQEDKAAGKKKTPTDEQALDCLVKFHIHSLLTTKFKILSYLTDKVLTENLGVKNHTGDSHYEVLKAIGHYNKKNYASAKASLTGAIKLNKSNVFSYYYAGIIYREENKNEKALKFFQKAIGLFPSEKIAEEFRFLVGEIYSQMGEIYEQEGNIEEAEKHYHLAKKNIKKSEPERLARIFRKRSLMRMKLKNELDAKWDSEKAIKYHHKAYLNDPSFLAEMHMICGIFHINREGGDHQNEALSHLDKVITYSTHDPDMRAKALCFRWKLHEKLKNLNLAARDYEEYLKIKPNREIEMRLAKIRRELPAPQKVIVEKKHETAPSAPTKKSILEKKIEAVPPKGNLKRTLSEKEAKEGDSLQSSLKKSRQDSPPVLKKIIPEKEVKEGDSLKLSRNKPTQNSPLNISSAFYSQHKSSSSGGSQKNSGERNIADDNVEFLGGAQPF